MPNSLRDKPRQDCKCGATRIDSQMGLERTPEEYISRMVEVFREVKRVLRDDGTIWVNMGDSYAGSGQGFGDTKTNNKSNTASRGARIGSQHGDSGHTEYQTPPPGLKAKDLVGVPWLLAFALRADGWYLRSDIIWAKTNPMPESVTDRPTKSHEYIFLLSKSQKYFYDAEAIKETLQESSLERGYSAAYMDGVETAPKMLNAPNEVRAKSNWRENPYIPNGRNKRTVWEVATQPTPDAHFATFPEDLIRPCILAGTSEKGCCVKCGAPRERQTERETPPDEVFTRTNNPDDGKVMAFGTTGARYGCGQKLQNWLNEHPAKTIGWQLTCACEAGTVQCTVLDPFFGSGTTGLVARANGCKTIGIELNQEYIEIAKRRLAQDVLQWA